MRAAIASVLALMVLFGFASPAAGERRTLRAGDPAPFDGVLFDAKSMQLMIEDYRDLDTARSLLGNAESRASTAESALAEKDQAIAKLQDALIEQRIAMAYERGRSQGYKDMEAERTQTLQTVKDMLSEERSSRRWEKILSIIPLIGAAFLLFSGGILH